MLIAERIESERLRQIIRECQRHRFGRRAESLPQDQLQLALEDTEQEAASGQAASEQKNPPERKARGARRRTNRGAWTARSAWTSCRPSSGCWWYAGRSMPAGLARMWSSRRRRRPD